MSDIYLFDVDGTLTPAKSKINPSFSKFFQRWIDTKEVYIVSGGTFVRIVDQLGLDIANMTSGVFPCMGNMFYQKRDQINENGYSEWEIIYENKFNGAKNLLRSLNSYVTRSDFPIKTGTHWEKRPGMMNFSIVGVDATPEQRQKFKDWDDNLRERERIVNKLSKKYPEIDFVIGGAVSIDIFDKGNDKAQVIPRYFVEALEHNHIHFIGDRISFPGNDHSLAQALREHRNGTVYEVQSWRDTEQLLKTDAFA
jgi:phosphomannomutase|tara:strand:- start:43 stop:801 length:759 start_codon:yes stop_codon:yes gene_type:complete